MPRRAFVFCVTESAGLGLVIDVVRVRQGEGDDGGEGDREEVHADDDFGALETGNTTEEVFDHKSQYNEERQKEKK